MQHNRTQIWHKYSPYFVNRAPNILKPWLNEQNSLTQAVVNSCVGKFKVRIYRQHWGKVTLSEQNQLNIQSNTYCFIRQVHLFCNNTPWIFARTVVPISTLRGELEKLTHLGTQPLGAILFANPIIQRDNIEIAKIDYRNEIYQFAMEFSKTNNNTDIWGRRSRFTLKRKPLLVSEIFLPTIPTKYLTCH